MWTWPSVWTALAVGALVAALTLHPEHAGSKSEYALVGVFFLLSAVALVTGFAAFRATRKRKRVSEHLAECVQAGQQIIIRCHATEKTREPAPEDEANTWANDIYTYLYDELGSDYAVRFNNASGIPGGYTVLRIPYSNVEGGVRWRSARLHEIMTELAQR